MITDGRHQYVFEPCWQEDCMQLRIVQAKFRLALWATRCPTEMATIERFIHSLERGSLPFVQKGRKNDYR